MFSVSADSVHLFSYVKKVQKDTNSQTVNSQWLFLGRKEMDFDCYMFQNFHKENECMYYAYG